MQDNKHTFLPLLGRHLISIKLDVFQVGIKVSAPSSRSPYQQRKYMIIDTSGWGCLSVEKSSPEEMALP